MPLLKLCSLLGFPIFVKSLKQRILVLFSTKFRKICFVAFGFCSKKNWKITTKEFNFVYQNFMKKTWNLDNVIYFACNFRVKPILNRILLLPVLDDDQSEHVQGRARHPESQVQLGFPVVYWSYRYTKLSYTVRRAVTKKRLSATQVRIKPYARNMRLYTGI